MKSTPSPPGRNRITEYEQAATPPVRKREGPAFEVIKKSRSPNDKRSPIQELPNGRCHDTLTHNRTPLIVRRGLDTYTRALDAHRSHLRSPCVETFP